MRAKGINLSLKGGNQLKIEIKEVAGSCINKGCCVEISMQLVYSGRYLMLNQRKVIPVYCIPKCIQAKQLG